MTDDEDPMRGEYLPTLEEIRVGCAEIQATWTPEVRRRREQGRSSDWTVDEVETPKVSKKPEP